MRGKPRAGPRGFPRRRPYQESALVRGAYLAVLLVDYHFVAERLQLIPLRPSWKLSFHRLRYRQLHRQFESRIGSGTSPGQILEVAGALVDSYPESVPDHVPEERDDVEQRALAARIGADEDVEAVERDVDVPKATVVQRLYAANHRASCSR